MTKKIKYIIVAYLNPYLRDMKADISVYCQKEIDVIEEDESESKGYVVWFTQKREELKYALTFNTRGECENYIKKLDLLNLISYGITEDELIYG